jgi:hypothetical protein
VRLPWEDGGVCETPRMGGRRLVALQECCPSVEMYTNMPAPRDSTASFLFPIIRLERNHSLRSLVKLPLYWILPPQ